MTNKLSLTFILTLSLLLVIWLASCDAHADIRADWEIIYDIDLPFYIIKSDGDNLYAASDIYWLVRYMLKRANADIDGEFYMQRLKKGEWRLSYRRKTADEQKADRRHQHQIDETKKLIERLKF